MFVPDRPLSSSLMLVGKVMSLPHSGNPERSCNRQDCKNTLAYFCFIVSDEQKSFITLDTRGVVNLAYQQNDSSKLLFKNFCILAFWHFYNQRLRIHCKLK
jgi:hypothetical protein